MVEYKNGTFGHYVDVPVVFAPGDIDVVKGSKIAIAARDLMRTDSSNEAFVMAVRNGAYEEFAKLGLNVSLALGMMTLFYITHEWQEMIDPDGMAARPCYHFPLKEHRVTH